jgi:hypothetical protein
MIAQLISQISSHFIIHYHRKVVRQATLVFEERHSLRSPATAVLDMEDDDSDFIADEGQMPVIPVRMETEREKLCDHAFARPHRGETEKLVSRAYISPLLIVVATSIVALVIVGCSIDSYSLDILGIVGVLVESGQQFSDATAGYSVFSTVSLLIDQAAFTGRVGDYIGLGVLSILLVATVLIVPLVQSIVLTYMWFMPITRHRRHRLMIMIEILAAWQYAEVFLLSVIVASW